MDTSSSRLFLGEVFRFWKADQSGSLLTLGDNALGAEFTTTIRAPSLLLGSYCGIGTSTPQAALDVVGSILGSAGLRIGNIDVIERLLEHGVALATLASNKQDKVSPDNPLPSLGYVYGLEAALSAAAASVVGIDGVTGLTEALAAKQSVIGPGSALECESLR